MTVMIPRSVGSLFRCQLFLEAGRCHDAVSRDLAVDTPYSKMAATQDGLGRVARKRGIEGHGTHSMRHRDVGIKFDLETFLLR